LTPVGEDDTDTDDTPLVGFFFNLPFGADFVITLTLVTLRVSSENCTFLFFLLKGNFIIKINYLRFFQKAIYVEEGGWDWEPKD
jgi:hypothetical protein